MGFPVKRILKIAAIGVGSGLVPGVGTAAGAALGGILGQVAEELGNEDDNIEAGWIAYAKGLESVEMTNDERATALREKIRSDIIATEKRNPKDRETNAIAELVVLKARGDMDS